MRWVLMICMTLSVLVQPALVSAGSGTTHAEDPAQADGLVQTKGVFEHTWVDPNSDLGQFVKIELAPVEFRYRDVGSEDRVISQTELGSVGDRGPYPMSAELRERFEDIVSEALIDAVERSDRFERVDAAGPDTLLVRGAFADITSNLPPLVAGSYDIYLSSAGSAKVTFELVDGGSGEVLARLSEEERIQPPGRMNEVSTTPASVASVANDMRIWAADVARDLLRAISRLERSVS